MTKNIFVRRAALLATAAACTAALSYAVVGGATAAFGLDAGAREHVAYDFFIGRGLPDYQAAAFVGNFDQEANFTDPTTAIPGATGIAQWNPDRWPAVVAYANQRNMSEWNLGLQLDYAWRELNLNYPYVLHDLAGTTTVESAVYVIGHEYEVCGECNYPNRNMYAHSALDRFGNDLPPNTTPNAAVTTAGNRHLFVITASGTLAERYEDASGWNWNGLGKPDGVSTLRGAPGVHYDRDQNSYDVFAVSGAGDLWRRHFDNGTWGNWTSIGGNHSLNGGLAVAEDQDGDTNIFATNATGSLVRIYKNASNAWVFDTAGGEALAGTPAVTYFGGANEFDVYAVSSSGYLREQDLVIGKGWGTFKNLGQAATGEYGVDVTATVGADGHQHLFVTGKAGAVHHLRSTLYGNHANVGSGNDWVVRDSLPDKDIVSAPRVIYRPGSDTYNVWGVSSDHDVYHQVYQPNDGWLSDWQDNSAGTGTNAVA